MTRKKLARGRKAYNKNRRAIPTGIRKRIAHLTSHRSAKKPPRWDVYPTNVQAILAQHV